MIDDQWNYDDEHWYDDEDDDQLDEEEAARCPECGAPMYIVTDKCPACGYWLSEGDRQAMWSGMAKPRWIQVTAGLILLAILAVVLLTLLAAL